jgi:hypothetical protein
MSFDHFLHYYEIVAEPLEKYIPVFSVKSSFAPTPVGCPPIYFSSITIAKP